MKKYSLRVLLCIALSGAGLTAARATDDAVTLNFVNSDIESTVKAVGLITGKNFVIDPKVKGTINIISNQPVARSLIFPILLSALRQQGITAVENDSIVKIMPDADAKTQALEVFTRKGRASGDRVVTQVFPLTHASASQLAASLRPLVSSNNFFGAYAGGNTIVVTDYADNVARIGQIIDNVDQPAASDIFPIRIRYASALDVAQTIGRLMPEVFVQGAPSPMPTPEGVKRTVIVSDVRNNQLLVRSQAAAHGAQIRALVASLDTPPASGSNINVVYLRNADAVALADTLKGILTGSGEEASSSGFSGSGVSSSSSGLTGSGSSFGGTDGSGTSTSSTSSQTSMLSTGASQSGSGGARRAAGVSVEVAGATVLIRADTATNALVITAPDHVYNNLRAVIDKLDVRRAQIYIEALIAEVNVSRSEELGVQWAVAGTDGSLSGGAVSNISPTATNLGALYSGYLSGVMSIPSTFSFGLFNGNFGVLATALESDGNGNVLSTPNLLTLDNEEARIMVGQNIPILTGSYTTVSGSTSNPFQTVERKDVGIVLKIKPQISDSGSITLTVAQEVSSVDNSVDTSGAGLATKVRQIDTKVLVDDGQTIVLGGLIEDKVTESKFKVPLLGDIPWMGGLFRYEIHDRSRVNLMVFLRPTILRDAKSSQGLSSERYEYLRAEQEKFAAPDGDPPVRLPPRSAPAEAPVDAPAETETGEAPAADAASYLP
ncbi:MAG: type II secretion system secretin GspD [Candidatus Accumulibacter sp.]|jgi:general secretion pathway protein D|nr:type II secretion system secretin GspD [Accumulibacter sp.]